MVNTKRDKYEPLCKIYKKNKKFQTIKFFSFPRDYNVFKDESNILDTIGKIKDILDKNCIAKKSLKKYDYERNISSMNLIKILKELDYNIIAQIINYDNKVIGILTSKEGNQLYIPCRPSSITFDLEFKFFQEIDLQSYEDTKRRLKALYNESNKRIPCDIKHKLIDGHHIVGIKTITNQIIPVDVIANTDDDIEEEITYSSANALELDDRLLIEKSIDNEREKIVKALELENNFYSLFRNTLKIILNYKTHNDTRIELLNIVESSTITYIEKLERIIDILHSLLDNVVDFTKFRLDDLSDYEEMVSCLGLNNNDCKEQKHCTFMRKNTCVLTLPSRNLYSNNDNESTYFNKLADEIIRYSKIRNYLFTPREFLSFEHVNYKINDDEIILLEELLLESYLEDIQLRQDNKYINTTNIYDIVNPDNKITYNTTFNQKNLEISNCIDKTKTVDSKYMKTIIKNISDKLEFIHYKSTAICMFEPIKTIIQDYTGKKSISIDNIKNKLVDAYLKLEMPPTTLIVNRELGNVSSWSVFSLINYYYGAKSRAKSIINSITSEKDEKIEFEIKQTKYKLNEFDIFLIFKEYKIPVIIKMKNKGSLLNRSVKIFDTSSRTDNEVYMILYYTKGRTRMSDFLGLAQKDKKYKIPKEILQDNLLEGEKDIRKYLITSLKKEVEEKERKKIQDREAQQRVRKKSTVVKKIKGKLKLSSK